MVDKIKCRSRKCDRVASLVSKENKRGFCSGILKQPYANSDPEDVVKFCFIDGNAPCIAYVVTPTEALSLASLLAWAYSEYTKTLIENGNEE